MTKDDQWSRWVLRDRIGSDPQVAGQRQAEVKRYRDTVLRNAALVPGDTVLDVGTGDGLIGFGAIDLLGGRAAVILSDISQPLLDHVLETAAQRGIAGRCRTLLASADELSNLENESVDVVTTRSVLIYVKEKAKAIGEFYRVLRAGAVCRFSSRSTAICLQNRGPVGFGGATVALWQTSSGDLTHPTLCNRLTTTR